MHEYAAYRCAPVAPEVLKLAALFSKLSISSNLTGRAHKLEDVGGCKTRVSEDGDDSGSRSGSRLQTGSSTTTNGAAADCSQNLGDDLEGSMNSINAFI